MLFPVKVLLYIAVSVCLLRCSLQAANIPMSEWNALHELFDSTNGDAWIWSNEQQYGVKWNFTNYQYNNPCIDNWQGIVCAASVNPFVVNISLESHNLNGPVPQSIGDFAQLALLDLSNNLVNGHIPYSIGNLTALHYLYFHNCYISGTIPSVLGNLTQLTALEVNHNLLTGSIPSTFGNLRTLKYLYVHNNYELSGTLPESLGQLHALITMNIYGTNIDGTIPPSFGNMTSLQYMNLYNNPLLTGTLPESLGQLSSLLTMSIYSTAINGTIPFSFGNLASLQYLYLYRNPLLTGTLPESLGQLASLLTINIYDTAIRGTIPHTIGNLISLQFLGLPENDLSGTIPASIGSLVKLKTLNLYSNRLNGTIPSTLGKLRALTKLYLYLNALTGTIPPEIGDCTGMVTLNFEDCLLTGSLPASFGQMRNLTSIFLYNNSFHGTIPQSYGYLNKVSSLDLSNNRLTGTIPALLGSLQSINYLNFCNNRLNGTIAPELGNLSRTLNVLSLNNNSLSGTIPAALGKLELVTFLDLSFCALSGSIPPSMGNMRRLRTLKLQSNQLTGPIPDTFTNFTHMQYLDVSDNALGGTIPSAIGLLQAMTEFYIFGNVIGGSIPSSFQLLSNLSVVQMQDNKLVGSLDGKFNASVQQSLTVVQLSDNQLTGTLPRELFACLALQTFAAVGNCFHGSISPYLCTSRSLITLALDGLHSSTGCRRPLLPGLSSSYAAKNAIVGTIPACLFYMPNLTTLHLSGNGLTGSLPDDLHPSPTLADLTLSHNALTGTLPAAVQQRLWSNLDVSYNRLTGELLSSVAADHPSSASDQLNASTATLYLNNNRFSGVLPGALLAFDHISVLTSCLFACNIDHSDLPASDPDLSNYQCGSDSFNLPYYIWMGCAAVGLTILALAMVGRWKSQTLHHWLAAFAAATAENSGGEALSGNVSLVQLNQYFQKVQVAAGAYCAYVLVVLVPLYVALSHVYGTAVHQYAYTVSAAFLRGVLPMALELLFWTLPLVIAQRVLIYRLAAAQGRSTFWTARSLTSCTGSVQAAAVNDLACASGSTAAEGSAEGTAGRSNVSQDGSPAQLAHRHPVERAFVYGSFILINFSAVIGVNVLYVYIALYQSNRLLLGVQVLLAFFKLFWNKVCARYLIRWITSYIGSDDDAIVQQYSREFHSVQLVVALFNNIAIPCLVVAVVSPNCFYNVFVAEDEVHASYFYSSCTFFNSDSGTCETYGKTTGTTSYGPPYAYNYQCSSSFITYYAPAFVYLSITAVFLAPLAEISAFSILGRCKAGSFTHTWVGMLVPRILKPPLAKDEHASVTRTNRGHVFDSNSAVVALGTYLGILLTFGVVFPPLAAAMAVAIVSTVLVIRLYVGRWISSTSTDADEQRRLVAVLEAECKGVVSTQMVLQSSRILVAFSCCFYTLFLFDALGDQCGFGCAYWVLIVVPLLPLAAYGLFAVYEGMYLPRKNSQALSVDVEMRDINADILNVLQMNM